MQNQRNPLGFQNFMFEEFQRNHNPVNSPNHTLDWNEFEIQILLNPFHSIPVNHTPLRNRLLHEICIIISCRKFNFLIKNLQFLSVIILFLF